MRSQDVSLDRSHCGRRRTEIRSGAELGCVTFSRLPKEAARQRQLHIRFGVNYILEDFTDPLIYEMIQP